MLGFVGVGRLIGCYVAIDRLCCGRSSKIVPIDRLVCRDRSPIALPFCSCSLKFLPIDRLMYRDRSAMALYFFSFVFLCSKMLCFVYFFISIFVPVLKSPVHSQNSSEHIKLEEITTIQDEKYDLWVSLVLTHHTPKLKPLLVLKQQSSNKCIIIPILFIHERNEELNAKCKCAKLWMNMSRN